jgi:hypothetical protein
MVAAPFSSAPNAAASALLLWTSRHAEATMSVLFADVLPRIADHPVAHLYEALELAGRSYGTAEGQDTAAEIREPHPSS